MAGHLHSAYQAGRRLLPGVAAGLGLLFIVHHTVYSGVISNTDPECADVLMLFARGSSSNPNNLNTNKPFSKEFEEGVPDPNDPSKTVGAEEIPGAFFRWMEKRIIADYPHVDYKAISVHYDPTNGYSQMGYPAVGIFNPDTMGNALQARFDWWQAGDYTESVTSGSQELAGHITANVINCPNQRIVVGGYSQGAEVVHEALKITTQSERNLIDNVVLFGDPKFISSDGSPWNPLDVHAIYPWVRGTAALKERGLGGAQIPYVPGDMWNKTISWCHEDDFVCTGMSGLSWAVTKHQMPGNDHSIWGGVEGALGDGHTRYPVFGIPEATGEVINNLHTHLSAIEASSGGINPAKSPYQQFYDASVHSDRPIDMVLALNYTGGNEDALNQYLQKLKDITKTYKKNFTQLNTGGALYTDFGGNVNLPNSSYVAGYARPFNQLSSDMDNAFKGNVYFGGGMGGGGDYPENHGMLVERSGMYAGWRSNAVKHLVIFAERPAHVTYSYNMCSPTVIGSLPHTGETPCVSGNQFLTKDRPEWCSSMIDVVSQDVCQFTGPTTTSKIISRSLNDAVALARAKGFVVDIVQPHTARNTQPAPYTPQYVENQLKTLAESTGGLYLKYDVFDEPAMRDAIWKILNHTPKLMSIYQHTKGSLLDFADAPSSFGPLDRYVEISVGQTNVLYASPVSGAVRYGWDVDGDGIVDRFTDAPVLEHPFFSVPSKLTVFAYADYGGTIQLSARVILAREAVPGQNIYEVVPGPQLEGVDANRNQGNSTTTVSWIIPPSASPIGLVLIRDASEILQTIPVSAGSTNVETTATEITLQYIDDGSESEPQTMVVAVNSPPIDETNDEEPELDEEVVDETEVPEENDDEQIVEPDDTPALNPVDLVGLDINKNVTQDEPNTTETGASSKPLIPVVSTQSFQQVALANIGSDSTSDVGSEPETTVVQSAQDVQSNPQGEVGGIDEVNQLFKGENLGAQTEVVEGNDQRWWIVVLGGIALVAILIPILILKRKNEDEE